MTVIVGYIYKERIYIGGDSMGSSSYTRTIRKDPKVFKNKNFLFGFTSSFRMGQILMSSKFDPPIQLDDQTDYDYMITTFVDHIRKLFSDGGYMKKIDEEELGGDFLVGFNGSLYKIEADFQVGIPQDNYIAIGCGAELALGAMYALNEMPMSVEEKLKIALNSASYFSSYCGGNFTILSI